MLRNGEGYVKGNLAQDAAVIMLESGKQMTKITVCKSRSRKDPKTNEWVELEPHYFDIISFDTLANRASSLKKGARVSVSFEHSPTSYETPDGKNIRTWSFIANDIEKAELLPKASVLSKIQSEESASV